MDLRKLLLPGIVPAAFLAAAIAGAPARADAERPVDFTSYSLEELMETEVTSVSKKAERLQDAPAAVYVISAEDIRRSGATVVPEVLRMVPGLEIARTGSHTWEISARGFRYRMANKFLVLVDGRAVYSPVYGTVIWEDQDVPLEDVERIEVIRGPGATLWGTNAVNGVINIITKKAVDTQGTLLRVHAGNEETLGVLARRGGTLGDRASWRVSVQGFRDDDLVVERGAPARDGWSGGLVEGRLDWTGRRGGEWSVEAHHQDHDRKFQALLPSLTGSSPTASFDTDLVLDWAIVSWQRTSGRGGRWSGRTWIDRSRTEWGSLRLQRATVDGQLEYAGPRSGRHRWFLGIGGRNNSYLAGGGSPAFTFVPPDFSDQIYSGYLQDDIALGPGHAHLVLGTKVEYTSASGTEIQPQVRAWWRWSPSSMAWAAVSRAARTPSWGDRSASWVVGVSMADVPGLGSIPVVYRLLGSPDVRAEHQVAHEAGFRWTPGGRFGLDVSGYWNEYRGVTTYLVSGPVISVDPVPHAEVLARYGNGTRLRFKGVDVLARWRPRDRVLLEAWWSWLEGCIVESAYDNPQQRQMERDMFLGVNPRHQLHLRVSADLPRGWELDGSIHWTDRLDTGSVPSWTRVDLRVGWHGPTRDREWSLAFRNVLGRHLEFRHALDAMEPEPGLVEPALVSRWTWRF